MHPVAAFVSSVLQVCQQPLLIVEIETVKKAALVDRGRDYKGSTHPLLEIVHLQVRRGLQFATLP